MIQGEEPAAVFGRPVVAEINHHPDVRVAAAEPVRLFSARVLPALPPVEVPVVGVLVDACIDARVGIDRVRADEVRAGDAVPEVAVDRVDEKQLAVLVPIVAPGIRVARALSTSNDLALRMIIARSRHASECAVPRAFLARRVRPGSMRRNGRTASHPGRSATRWRSCGSSPAGTVNPSSTTSAAPSGTSSPFAIGDEQDLRRAHRPHAAASHFDAREHLQFVGENLPRVETAVAIVVFENENPVAQLEVELLRRPPRKCNSPRPTTARARPMPWRSDSARPVPRRKPSL